MGSVQDPIGMGPCAAVQADPTVPGMTRGSADTQDLALGDALVAKRLHEVLDAAGGDALHVGLLHDGQQRSLAASARFEQGGEGAALPHLRDLQLQGAHPRVPRPGPVAVAVGNPLRTAPAPRPRADGHFRFHHRLDQHPEPLAQEVEVSIRRASMHNSSNTFFLSFAIAVASSFLVVDEGDPVAPVLPAPAVCYTTSWDMTARGLSTKRNPRWVCETQRGL